MRAPGVVLLVTMVGCGSSGDDDGPPDFQACPTQHAETDNGFAVIVCDTASPELPRIHLPADTQDTLYVALDPLAEGGPLVTREGQHYFVSDGTQVIPFAEANLSRLPAGLEYGSYRFLYSIYEVKGTIGTAVEPIGHEGPVPAIHVSRARPVVRIDSTMLDGAIQGSWEGRIPRKIGDHTYDPQDTVPFRFTIASLGSEQPLLQWDVMTEVLDGHPLFLTEGVVDNQDDAVTLADGTCVPSLASLGTANPFTGATSNAIKFYRMVGMHVPGDYQLVFDFPEGTGFGSGMGSILPAHPAAMIQTAPREAFTRTSSAPHGTPTGMDLIDLHRVEGGGTPCNP